MFQDIDSSFYLQSFVFLFLLIQGKFCVFPLFAGLLRSLKTFYLSRLCSTGGSLLQPNGPFPCDLELFRQITQKQIREI